MTTLGAYATPSLSAEKLAVSYNSLMLEVPITDLETLATEGAIPSSLAFYGAIAKPEQIQSTQNLLSQRLEVDSVALGQFLSLPEGEYLLDRVGTLIKTDLSEVDRNAAIHQALMAAAKDGFSLLNVIRHFPAETLELDFAATLALIQENAALYGQRDALVKALWARADRAAQPLSPQLQQEGKRLQEPGRYRWMVQSLEISTAIGARSVEVALYQPEEIASEIISETTSGATSGTAPLASSVGSIPLVILSHGLGGDRQTLNYLAQHLTSHGFAVVALEHPDSNRKRFSHFLQGMTVPPPAEDLAHRPRLVTAVLDTLEKTAIANPQLQRLNLKSVGILGQSLGGYTALAAAGAEINRSLLQQTCSTEDQPLTLNLSLPIQCRYLDLPDTLPTQYKDNRITAVMALNPLTSHIFGSAGLEKLEVPTMVVASTHDYFTPALVEQIQPFGWLTSPEKYLLVANPATHFSLIEASSSQTAFLPNNFVGPTPKQSHPAMQALSLAFFQKYLRSQPQQDVFLNQAYVYSLEQEPFEFSLVRSLPPMP